MLLEPGPGAESFRLRALPEAGFAGLEPAGAWPRSEGFLLQLFRNPLDAPGAPSPEPGLFLLEAGAIRSFAPPALSGLGGREEELFALFPDPRKPGAWFAQLRSIPPLEPVRSRFLYLPSLEGSAIPLAREVFEAELRPASLGGPPPEGGLPEGLAAAATRLGGEDFLLRLRDAEGRESYWGEGSPERALSLEAWASREGLILLESSGRALLLDRARGAIRELRLEAPVPGASFGTAALLSREGGFLAAAAWEAGRASGLLVFRL